MISLRSKQLACLVPRKSYMDAKREKLERLLEELEKIAHEEASAIKAGRYTALEDQARVKKDLVSELCNETIAEDQKIFERIRVVIEKLEENARLLGVEKGKLDERLEKENSALKRLKNVGSAYGKRNGPSKSEGVSLSA